MKSLKSYKIAGAAALALTLGLTPISDLFPGSTSSAFAAESQKDNTKTSWDLELQNAPFKKNGVLFVPVKELSEYLDLHITLTSNKKYVYINSPLESVRIAPGQSKAVNAQGTTISLGAAPVVKKGVTYVPASLLTKSFGIPIKWNGKKTISLQGSKQYVSSSINGMVFWLNRDNATLLTGQAGSVPRSTGKVEIENIDWIGMKPRKINASSYVVDIWNSHGEPHIHETDVRVLLNKGKIVKQGTTHFSNFSGIRTNSNVNGFKGNVAIMDGSTLQLVHPTGKVVKTYDLEAITGVEDDFVVEAIENDFLLVRPFIKSTLFIVHPTAKKSVLIYPELLDENAKKLIEEYPPNEMGYVGDALSYAGYKNQELTFTFSHPILSSNSTFTYKLPF